MGIISTTKLQTLNQIHPLFRLSSNGLITGLGFLIGKIFQERDTDIGSVCLDLHKLGGKSETPAALRK